MANKAIIEIFKTETYKRVGKFIEHDTKYKSGPLCSRKRKITLLFQFQNVYNEMVELTTKNSALEFYACFVENGVVLLPRCSADHHRATLIRKIQEKIAILRPQLKTEQEVGVLIHDGLRKG